MTGLHSLMAYQTIAAAALQKMQGLLLLLHMLSDHAQPCYPCTKSPAVVDSDTLPVAQTRKLQHGDESASA